ncbi:hypothetical protein CSPB12327_05875 [Campylobacter sp. RM12327]|uniref:HMA2 domain-containing protein n=1 Tax=Campylobacter sputorum TaxID=206 RepID=UPI000B76F0D6|nr:MULTISPECIES: hypothetical protein [Campylobacter]ASM40783.1 hypothetical protein CSPB_1618 [Campylobacter sputorum]MBE7357909.1 hypothetical protein [Campylobacter sp. RM11302]MBF6669664.1 hypothetical protein [Campylobacter sp. RM12327]MBF6674807.1 hypothetical protein [Campylobacter sp. RM13538]MBF6675755.1 hypothetical protein [Campylobacter sp. RM12321]
MITKDFLVSVLSHCKIIHHTHGRLRLRISSKIKDEFENLGDENLKNINLTKLDEMIKNINGIKNVKFNRVIGSITIEYDKKEFDKDFWNDIIEFKKVDNFLLKINEKAKELL